MKVLHFHMKYLLTLLVIFSTSLAFADKSCSDYFSQFYRNGESDFTLTEDSDFSVPDYLSNHRFRTNRGLTEYESGFSNSLLEVLEYLPDRAVWYDMGAGEALAQIEYFDLFPGKKTKMIAVGLERPNSELLNTALSQIPLFEYQDSIYVGSENFLNRNASNIGQVDLITDFLGPLSYSQNFFSVLSQYLALLKRGGKLIINLQQEVGFIIPMGGGLPPPESNNIFASGNEPAHRFREPAFLSSPNSGFFIYLDSIQGIDFEYKQSVRIIDQGRNSLTRGMYEKLRTVVITKTTEDVLLPTTRVEVFDQKRTPPYRVFRWDPFHLTTISN